MINSDQARTKFNVASSHIMENKQILAYLIKDSLTNYSELSIDEIAEKFLSQKELKQRGEENQKFLEEHAEVPGRETFDRSYTEYTIAQPGRVSLIQIMLKVNNKELDEESIKELYEDTLYSTMERFSANALFGNSIYDSYGNPIQLVCQYQICLFPPKSLQNTVLTPEIKFVKEQVYPPSDKEPEVVPINSPFTFFIFGLGRPAEGEELRTDNQLLDTIFTGSIPFLKKLEILKENYEIDLDEDEKLDLLCITEYLEDRENKNTKAD